MNTTTDKVLPQRDARKRLMATKCSYWTTERCYFEQFCDAVSFAHDMEGVASN